MTTTDNLPIHPFDLRTNSHLSLNYDTGRMEPLVELIIVGYRPEYELEQDSAAKTGMVVKKMKAHTVRLMLGLGDAQLLRDNADKVIEHLQALKTVADAVNDGLAPAAKKDEPTTEDPQPGADNTNRYMANPKIIISSTALLRELGNQPRSRDLTFGWTAANSPREILIGSYVMPVETKDFSPFTISGKQVGKLVNLLKLLEEQPIALEWDGSWVILKEVIIS